MPTSAKSEPLQDPPPNPEPYHAPAADPPPDAPPSSSNAPPTPTAPAAGGNSPFDKGAAAAGLSRANVQRCSAPGGPTGMGHVTVTFVPTGTVGAAVVDQGPFPGTAVGGCIARVFGTITVPPFSGPPVRVGKSFVLR